jgi:diguanylate cyclase (GGDEF)-like protein/PAS domain S-box-containing protein
VIVNAIKKSIVLKVLGSVGLAVTLMFILQSYLNISNFQRFVEPLIVRDLDASLQRSKNVFDNLYKQTIEDARIIRSHNSLTNYLDYEQLNDQQSQNQELVDLEQFLSSLIVSKPRYREIEIITTNGPVIHLKGGLVVEPSAIPFKTHQLTQSNELVNGVEFETRIQDSQQDTKLALLKLNYQFSAENDFIAGQASKVSIQISHQINEPLQALAASLQSSNIEFSAWFNNQPIVGDFQQTDLSKQQWLTKQTFDQATGLLLAVRIKKANAFLFVDEMQRSIIILAISLLLVVAISQLITIRLLIARPLKKLIDFINDRTIQSERKSIRFQTTRQDEIGVFAQGLNSMLDHIQSRDSALVDSEERLGLALWGSGDGLWEYTPADEILFLDEMSCKILGLTDCELKMNIADFSDVIHSDEADEIRAYFSDFMQSDNELFDIEFRVKKDQTYIWLQLTGKLVSDSQENIKTAKVVGTFRNITRQRAAEEQIRLYAKAFDSSGSAILILDKKLVVLAANDAFNQITGFNFSQVVGRIPDFILDSHHSSFSIKQFTQQINLKGTWQNELIGVKANGDRFVQDISINVIVDQNKSPTHYVCSFSDITQKKKSEEDLWNMANHDILTGLPNRGFFRKTLEKTLNVAAKTDESVSLLFIDLDRFKQVNDTLGHEIGDNLLKKVADILSKVARKSDYAARLGGDEFAIILEGVSEHKLVERVAKSLVSEFTKGFMVEGKDTGVGLSIGISVFPDDAKNVDDLFHFADTAMYFSKTH